MAFKPSPPKQNIPDSPEKLLSDLPRRKIKGVLLHQGEIMRAYQKEALDKKDVALQLPTGSGKTLVGLMIAEWIRRKNKERILYLCPTKQLVHQVVEQANEQYGLSVNGFTGSKKDYSNISQTEYQNADKIAITTYSTLFNTKPFFSEPEVIIVDDAHTADNYISDLWSLRIERANEEHRNIYDEITKLIKPHIESTHFKRLTNENQEPSDSYWIDKLPTPTLYEIKNELFDTINDHVTNTNLKYAWEMIKDNISDCHLYLSSREMLIRPLIPPTWTHSPFNGARQRIFMSATLSTGGDLERITGRDNILRLPVPDGWDRQVIGRRYFIFPSQSLEDEKTIELQRKLIKKAKRAIFLVPSEQQKSKIEEELKQEFQMFNVQEIEKSKKPFTDYEQAVAVMANRYDGIDFPGNECRLLCIYELPKTTNLQERFLVSRMEARVIFNERIHARVLQAIGRCTRSSEDYSAVVVTGEYSNHLVNRKHREFFHPELQAEIEFGIEQSKDTNITNLLENFDIFLSHDTGWESADNQIIDKRSKAKQIFFPAMEVLKKIVSDEIEFQKKMWQKNYKEAMQIAEKIIIKLESHEPELRGYRALWNYLAGSAAWQEYKQHKDETSMKKSRQLYEQAKKAAPSIPWLVTLSKYQSEKSSTSNNNEIMFTEQIENLERILENKKTMSSDKYDKYEIKILDGLNKPKTFESSQTKLGKILGFNADKEEKKEQGAPDSWWTIDNICIVFENHVNAQKTTKLGIKKARQVASHPNWIETNLSIPEEKNCKIIPVLVSPVQNVHTGLEPHLDRFYYWNLDGFKSWAEKALKVIKELSNNFVESGDTSWRANATEKLKDAQLDGDSIKKMLLSNRASEKLKN